MSSPGVPQLEQLADRAFSFYPAIVGVEHNEWKYLRATWSEVLVVNTKSGDEVWVPRREMGEISKIEEPVMIVGLNKELEFKAGQLWPFERRVISMPRPVGPSPAAAVDLPKPTASEVMGLRSGGNESKIGWVIGFVLIFGILACFLVVNYFGGTRIEYTTVMQEDLGLTASDDYYAVLRKLGEPGQDRWKEGSSDLQYRALYYPARKFTVILMGTERKSVHYLGAVNENWRPVHTVTHPGRGNTRSMLEGLKKF